jgi:hypothetical protein
MSSRTRRGVASLALALAALLAATASAERVRDGNLIVTLNGGITPLELPRHRPAPVTVHLSGRVLTSDTAPLPRVNWIRLELAWRGRLFTKGLPVCPLSRIRFANHKQAEKLCGGGLVGHGRLFARVFVPHQSALDVHAQIEAFNGRSDAGGPLVLVHAYTPRPPVSFVIPFSVHRRRQGRSVHTVLIAMIRRSVGPWPRIANFQIKVSRSFSYLGKRRSYLSASCPIPPNFTAGFLSFARATYTFEGGKQLKVESVRTCRSR